MTPQPTPRMPLQAAINVVMAAVAFLVAGTLIAGRVSRRHGGRWSHALYADGPDLDPPVVWIITALDTWILGCFVLKRWWDKRTEEKNIRRALA